MQRKIIVSFILMAVCLGGGAGVMLMLVKSRPSPDKTDTDRPPLLVEWVEMVPQTLPEIIAGYGTARADRYARISAQVFGEVVELAEDLKPGTAFSKGDVLIRIDDREYRQMLTQAEAALRAEKERLAQLDVEEANLKRLLEIVGRQYELQKAEYERIALLFRTDTAQPSEYRQQHLALATIEARLEEVKSRDALLPTQRAALNASLERLQAQVEIARLNVERCTIRAPFDGQVDQLMLELGERVQVGMPLLAILDPTLLEVPVELPVSLRERVRVGASCSLSLESANPATWRGRVKRVAPSANQLTRTFAVYLEVDNRDADLALMQGAFVQAEIEGPMLENVYVVPRGAIQDDRVFTFKDGVSVPRTIEVERHLLDESVVRGVDKGDIVITSNLDALYDGTPVRLEEAPVGTVARGGTDLKTGPRVDPQ